MIRFTFECDTEEELYMVRKFFSGAETLTASGDEDSKKQKKAEYDKQRYQEKKNSTFSTMKNSEKIVKNSEKTVENSEKSEISQKEERDEKGFSPLVSPLSFPPLTPNPITPISPLSEKAEREEKYFGADGEDEPPILPSKRGKLIEFGTYVRLSEREFDALKVKFGQEKAERMIRNMDSYIGEDPKRQRAYTSRNHYLTLLNWERRHQEMQAKQPKQIPKEKSFADIARELREKEGEDVIDSFWRV